MITESVRVATTNNFNCTQKEWAQLNRFVKASPEKSFFVNSNIHTPKLLTVTDHPYKVVVTANPNLELPQSGIEPIISRLEQIRSHLAFVRVKYLPNHGPIDKLLTTLINMKIPVVITMQRFNSEKTLRKFTSRTSYAFSCSRFRLAGFELKKLETFVSSHQAAGRPVWICDQAGTGCGGCGLCSKLTTGEDHKITSLNLSTSGICPYNCPDCYAKTMQNFSTKLGHKPIIYDVVRQNDKQSGRTAHIKKATKQNENNTGSRG